MANQPTDDELHAWHRRFASMANNRAWERVEQAQRTASEDQEMLEAAFTAAYHWKAVGTEHQIAHAELLLGLACSKAGCSSLALQHAEAAVGYFTTHASADWELAFAHAGMASAAWSVHQADRHREQYALAEQFAGKLTDPEDQKIFQATFQHIPKP